MKMQKHIYDQLFSAISPFVSEESIKQAKAFGWTYRRFQWECFYRTKLTTTVYDSDRELCDSHIETALKKMIPKTTWDQY